MRARQLASFLVLAVILWSQCKKTTLPSPPAQPAGQKATREIQKDQALLYTYVEEKGTFVTTDKAEDVPEKARGMVRVVDPKQPASEGADPAQVFVVDLQELLTAGKAQARAISREAFETSALAQLPPGESSPMQGPRGPALPDDGFAVDAGALGPPVVVLYGASWCGACKTAKQYLASRRIPFAYKDIENDSRAAQELREKAARMGVPYDRIPILEVRGRLLIGFDKDRLEAMLGTPT